MGEYQNLRNISETINKTSTNKLCKKGKGLCCTIYAPVIPEDGNLILDSIQKGTIDNNTVVRAIKNAQNPMRVSCPWLENGECSIYDQRPLTCMIWGVAGRPKMDDKRVREAVIKLNTTRQDQQISASCITAFSCESCHQRISPNDNFSLGVSIISKMVEEYTLTFENKGLTTMQGFLLNNQDKLKG